MKTWMVETQALKKYYRLGENTVKALDGVDLTVERGEFVAMIGKSGSGKSTLLHMLGGLACHFSQKKSGICIPEL